MSRTVEVKIIGNASSAKKAFGQVESAASSMGKKLGSAAIHVAKVTAMLGAAGMAGGLYAVAKAGLKFNSSIEQTTISLTTMLKSQEKANDLIEEMTKFAAKTPFEFPELADATKKLIAFGVSAKDIIPTMTMLGDLSAGLGIQVGELAELYGKAKVQGRLYMEDINQLTGRGIPIIQEFAKQFGVAESEVRKLVESGKIGFPELEIALQSLTKEGGMFNGMMEAQSKSLAGLMSTLKDEFAQFASVLMTPIFALLVETIIPNLIEAISWLREQISTEGSTINNVWDSIKAAVSRLWDFAVNVAFPAIERAVATVYNWCVEHKATFIAIWDGIKAAMEGLRYVAVEIVWPGILWAVGEFKDFINKNHDTLTGIWDELKELFTKIYEIGVIVWPAIKEALETAWPAIKLTLGLMCDMFEALLQIINGIMSGMKWIAKNAIPFVGNNAINKGMGTPFKGGGPKQHGGIIQGEGPQWVLGHGGERVLSQYQTGLFERMVAALEKSQRGGATVINVSGGPGVSVGKEIVAALAGM